jgi:hypothetical protein
MTMPAGEYYIGDLCYVMTDDEWTQFCNITIQGNQVLSGEFELPDGRRFATYSTAWGDGRYYDQDDREYSVDAGLIGCIKLADIKADKYNDIETLGNISQFHNDFVTGSHRGTIFFDNIKIKTSGEE